MGKQGRDWRTILLGASSLGGALLAFTFAILIFIYSAIELLGPDSVQYRQSTLQNVIIASGISMIGMVFLPAVFYSIQRLRGKEIPAAAPSVLKVWQGSVLLVLWAGSAVLAQSLVDKDILKWFTPPLYLSAIGIPVYFLVRLASGGLQAGSRQRVWGVMATSIALGATLSIVAEMILVLIGLTGAAGYLALNPGQIAPFKQIADQITNASDIDTVFTALKPWLESPPAFLLALLFFSGFVPIIEETSKSLAVWTVFDHLNSPAQGFVIGALSGAGFGFFESLLASATPDASWAATLLIRGGSTMMHIMAASLTGWGIAFLRTGPPGGMRAVRSILMYALAISMHGLWNASIILTAFGSLRMPVGASPLDPLGTVMVFSGISLLVILCLIIPLALGIINKRLRSAGPLDPTPALENIPGLLPAHDHGEKKEQGTITS